MRAELAMIALMLSACSGAVASGQGIEGDWRLATIDNAPIPGSASMTIAADGRISGEAPCNSFMTTNTATAPAFKVKNIASTRRQCFVEGGESRFFAALKEAEQARLDGGNLILTGAGGEMVFTADDSAGGATADAAPASP